MKNEPDEIKAIRDGSYFRIYRNNNQEEIMLHYINQLQGLLEGRLMYNSESQIVPRVPMSEMQIGDMWYTPLSFAGPMTADMLYEDTDED